MIGLLNLGSLVLGLIAWILPIVTYIRYKKHDHGNWVGSFHYEHQCLCYFAMFPDFLYLS